MKKLPCLLLFGAAIAFVAPLLAADGVDRAATNDLPPALLDLEVGDSVVTVSDAHAVRGEVIDVDIDCDIPVVTIISDDKDLSNVVLQFDDGSTFKFDGLSGKVFSFDPDDFDLGIVGVYVKAGDNQSGGGPGFGEFFELVPCPEPPTNPPTDPPTDPPTNPPTTVTLTQDKSFSVGANSGYATGSVSLFEGLIGTFAYNKLSQSFGADDSAETLALNVAGNIGGLTGDIRVNQNIASPDYGSLNWFTAGKTLTETTNFTGDFMQNFNQHFEVLDAPITAPTLY